MIVAELGFESLLKMRDTIGMHPDMMIFWAVVGLRFGVPLLIPRYPLPAIIAALLLDAVDQTIFQQFTSLNLDGYQSYDKALDIYYLVIAYLSTMRNWTNLFAYKMARFLIYYRLVGVVLFELLQNRTILLIFPNTFEYFFIFYEAMLLRWQPSRLTKKLTVAVTAFIWIFIKLPQEYWIHVAQKDVTETINTLLGEPIDTPMVEAFLAHPEVLITLISVIVGLVVALWWVVTRKLPKKDRGLSFTSKAHITSDSLVSFARVNKYHMRLDIEEIMEKLALLTLVTMIFGQIIPGRTATGLQLIAGVMIVVVSNALISHWLKLRGRSWPSVFGEFGVMVVINLFLSLGYIFLLPGYSGGQANLSNVVFLVLLISVMVTLYDRFRPIYEARFVIE